LLPWDIYRVAAKAMRIGSVEAGDESSAIEAAAKEFNTEAWPLIAMRR